MNVLEKDNGAGWKLVFRLLARGRLTDPETDRPLLVTCNTLIRESEDLFKDL